MKKNQIITSAALALLLAGASVSNAQQNGNYQQDNGYQQNSGYQQNNNYQQNGGGVVDYVTVDSIRQVRTKSNGSGGFNILGPVVGGAAGAAVGSRFGNGKGKTALTVAGAVAGAVAGNAVQNGMKEKDNQERVMYEIRIRHQNNFTSTVVQEDGNFSVGQSVRAVTNGNQRHVYALNDNGNNVTGQLRNEQGSVESVLLVLKSDGNTGYTVLGPKGAIAPTPGCNCSYEVKVKMQAGNVVTMVQDVGANLSVGQRVRVVRTNDAQGAIFTL